MENSIGHRRLPPQRTGLAMSQASIAKAVVPEVSLVWEGEESVYWRPNSPCPRPTVEHSSALRTSSSMPLLTARPAMLPSRWPCSTTSTTGAVQGGPRYQMQHQALVSQENMTGGIRGTSQSARFQSSASSQSRQGVLKESPLDHQTRTVKGSINDMQNLKTSVNTQSPELRTQSIAAISRSKESVDKKLEHENAVSPDTESHPCNSPPESTKDALARLMQAAEYNPLIYSSGGRNGQATNVDNRKLTPQLRKDPKSIIPRAMNFAENVNHNADITVMRSDEKENISPTNKNISGQGRTCLTSSSDVVLRQRSENQIVPYDQSGSDSPQMQISSPAEPYLCKMLDRKDQQIFQLHKVLEAVLSKANGNCSSNSLPSSELPLQRAVGTQTSYTSDKPASCTVGINTDITWSELLESVREERATASEQRSVTILKNSNLRRAASSTIVQKSSNTSSVRFDTCHQMMESDEHIAEVRGEEVTAANGNEEPQHCRCCQCVASVKAVTGSKNALLGAGDRSQNTRNVCADRQLDTRNKNHHPSRNGPALGDGGFAEGATESAEAAPHYTGSNHREVSLTLRELVLTTIQEDPVSPQHSLHLDLPEYRGDTLHQQMPSNRPVSPTAAGRRVAAQRPARDGSGEHRRGPDHRGAGSPTTAPHSHRPSPSPGDGRHRPVTATGAVSAAARHHGTPPQYQPPAHRLGANKHTNSHENTECSPLNPSNGHHGNGARDVVVESRRRDRGECDNQPRGGTGGGVTIYRNLVNNLEQILEPASHRPAATDGGPHTGREGSGLTGCAQQAGGGDQHLDVLQQQLRHFGLSFLERKPLQDNLRRTDGGFPHPSPPPDDAYRNTPRPGSAQPYDSNPRPGSAEPYDNKSPVDFSIATVEFLRQNGLLNRE